VAGGVKVARGERVARMVERGVKAAVDERVEVEVRERAVSVAKMEAETLGLAVREAVGDCERMVNEAAGDSDAGAGLAVPRLLPVPSHDELGVLEEPDEGDAMVVAVVVALEQEESVGKSEDKAERELVREAVLLAVRVTVEVKLLGREVAPGKGQSLGIGQGRKFERPSVGQ